MTVPTGTELVVGLELIGVVGSPFPDVLPGAEVVSTRPASLPLEPKARGPVARWVTIRV